MTSQVIAVRCGVGCSEQECTVIDNRYAENYTHLLDEFGYIQAPVILSLQSGVDMSKIMKSRSRRDLCTLRFIAVFFTEPWCGNDSSVH